MRIYLSDYWKKNLIVGIIFVFIIVVSTGIFCVWNYDEEDYFLIVGSLFFVLLFCYLISKSLTLVRYVTEEDKQLVMYSFRKQKKGSLNLDSKIYYEVLPLMEGSYSRKDFVVLSNKPFASFQKRGVFGLAKICKEIDANGGQIIAPYNNPYVMNLLDDSACQLIK